ALAVVAVGSPILAGILAPGDDGTPNGAAASASSGFGEKPPKPKKKLFEDKFGDEKSGWKTDAASGTSSAVFWDASYRDRKYALRTLPAAKQTVVPSPAPSTPASQLVEVEVESGGAGTEAGVYCRGTGGGFAFLLRPDGRVRILAMTAGSPGRELKTGTADDLNDGDNRIHAACVPDGSSVRLGMWVNDELVTSTVATASEGGDGGSGLVVTSPGGTPEEATFDDYSLCEI
ncbi:MAG: hypothetical protein ACRDNL_06240, partial [Spirillospora sp.]